MEQQNGTMSVGAIVAAKPGLARIFEDLGIDYCCGGALSLQDACAERGLDLASVLQKLEAGPAASEDYVDVTGFGLTEMVDHIEATHHAFLRSEMPRLVDLFGKVVAAHGERHGEIRQAARVYADLCAELESHMMKEEQVLFPYVRELDAASGPLPFHCGSVAGPIRVMMMEHDSAGEALAMLRELTHDFTVPDDGCATYAELLRSLLRFERDLHQHVHKENNILFPRLLAQEAA